MVVAGTPAACFFLLFFNFLSSIIVGSGTINKISKVVFKKYRHSLTLKPNGRGAFSGDFAFVVIILLQRNRRPRRSNVCIGIVHGLGVDLEFDQLIVIVVVGAARLALLREVFLLHALLLLFSLHSVEEKEDK